MGLEEKHGQGRCSAHGKTLVMDWRARAIRVATVASSIEVAEFRCPLRKLAKAPHRSPERITDPIAASQVVWNEPKLFKSDGAIILKIKGKPCRPHRARQSTKTPKTDEA